MNIFTAESFYQKVTVTLIGDGPVELYINSTLFLSAELSGTSIQEMFVYRDDEIFYIGDASYQVSVEVLEDPRDIDDIKYFLRDKVDLKTQSLIYNGFSFQGIVFSLSDKAQINWSNFPNLPQSIFPLNILGINDEPFILQYADVMMFYLTAVATKNSHLQSGNVLKQQINAMTTKQQLEQFIDNR